MVRIQKEFIVSQSTVLLVSCKLKLIQEVPEKGILRIILPRMEGHGWEGVLLDTFRLHSGGHVFLIEPIQSLKQEIRVDPEAGQDDDGPDDPGGSGLSVADVGETMDRCGGEKSICFLLKASNSHLFHKLTI